MHWHGVRVPIEMDGVPDISQPEVQPGESFAYDFVVRDAGLYWYHPHVMSAAQVGFGLYGALLVEDPADGVGVADKSTLVLSDIGFDATASSNPRTAADRRDGIRARRRSRARQRPHRPVVRARSGAPQRWRIVNAAKSRYFQLDLDGHRVHGHRRRRRLTGNGR